MIDTLEIESMLPDSYRTTIPLAVRRALKLGKGDKIRYLICSDGQISLTRSVLVEHLSVSRISSLISKVNINL